MAPKIDEAVPEESSDRFAAPTAAIGSGFRALTELAPDFVAVLSGKGTIKYVSPAVARVTGFRPEELVGRWFLDFVAPEDRARGEQDFKKVLGGGDIVPVALRYTHKDGSFRIIETLARDCSDNPGIKGVLVSTRDVTERVTEEKALREALAEAEDLYNNAPCGYHSLDASGRYLKVNKTELSWIGYAREELIGKISFRSLLTPESQIEFDRQFAPFKLAGSVQDLEYTMLRRDGTQLTVLLSASRLTDAAGRFLMSRATLYDISERKRAEAALRRTNRALLVLSAVNSELIHAEQEPGLLEAICRVTVELAGYRMAWVGYAEHDAAKSVRPVAQSGFDQGYLERSGITWGAGERGAGPTGTAIRTGTVQVNQNFLVNPRMAPWREQAVKRGYQSSIALPLREPSRVFGALMIYAQEPDAFETEEVKLLTEMADDLAFGIQTLRQRAEHRRAEERVAFLAFHDEVTRLPNRSKLLELVAQASDGVRAGKGPFALLALNLAQFEDIQAGIGVQLTDALLRDFAARLRTLLRDDEVLARIQHDTFAILLRDGTPASARHCAQRIEQSLSEPFMQRDIPISIQTHIGAAIAPGHGLEPEALLLRSGIAARHAGRAGVLLSVYGGPSEAESPRTLALISELRAAIEAGQLVLHYQPKVDLAAGRVASAEALVRWRHPQCGLLMPAAFIPLAEQTGLIRPLTYAVLEAALHQCFLWSERRFELPIAVNITASMLKDADFPARLGEMLQTWNVSPRSLKLEITETSLMEEPARASDVLTALKERGIGTEIDDFGTGYSSLGYVASLPIDTLKIDRSFITRMLDSARIASVIKATVSLADSLGIACIAEGVDAKPQAEALYALGCTNIQGFLFSEALPPDRLCEWVADFSLARYGLRLAKATA